MSYIERTARKLMPILNEIKGKMVPEKTLKDKVGGNGSSHPQGKKGKAETLESVHEDVVTEEDINENASGGIEASKKAAADMKNILGYLNQGEWTTTLSIGSIM